MSNILDKFTPFCAQLKIKSKEYGVVPLKFWGTQRRMLEEIYKGFDDGVRHFIILKCRQAGISTASLALTNFWLYAHSGILGALITDTGSNLTRFRETLRGYMKSLPPSMRRRVLYHNINELGLGNESVLSYLVAGTRKKKDGGDLGQGKGLNFVHATEVSSWPDADQINKLIDSLAEVHPDRLFIFESTANGFNTYYEMWETAKKAKTQRAIFLGWWLKELYAVHRDSPIYRVYWDGKYTSEETKWVREVKQLYGWEMQPEQMAWWRWKLEEGKMGDLNNMYQEFPPTEEHAFVMSGYKFFGSEKLTVDYKRSLKHSFTAYRYTFGNDFVDTRLHKTTIQNAQMLVWEEPHVNGVYVVGADPAYGFNEQSDRSTASVWRCYADRLVQVAEFSAPGIGTAQFAWVLLHLVGTWRNLRVNIELTGPGTAVFNELQNVRKVQAIVPEGFASELSGLKHHFYSREDTLHKSFAYHSKTTADQKELMLNRMNDLWRSGVMEVRSLEMLQEMKYFARDGAILEGRGGEHDDRVIAAALAVLTYLAWAKNAMLIMGQTQVKVTQQDQLGNGQVSSMVMNFLESRGFKK